MKPSLDAKRQPASSEWRASAALEPVDGDRDRWDPACRPGRAISFSRRPRREVSPPAKAPATGTKIRDVLHLGARSQTGPVVRVVPRTDTRQRIRCAAAALIRDSKRANAEPRQAAISRQSFFARVQCWNASALTVRNTIGLEDSAASIPPWLRARTNNTRSPPPPPCRSAPRVRRHCRRRTGISAIRPPPGQERCECLQIAHTSAHAPAFVSVGE